MNSRPAKTAAAKTSTDVEIATMPYNPAALSVAERSRLLTLLWLGVPASLLHLAGQFVAMPRPFDFLPGCQRAGVFIGGLFKSRHDEFIERQMDRAARVALGAAGLVLLASLLLFGPLITITGSLALAMIAAVFNLALGWFRLKGE